MTVVVTGRFVGGTKVELLHEQSGSTVITDAPRDNHGEGSAFSPTDLVAGALGSCMMTIVAIIAKRDGLNVDGMWFRVEKHMAADPPRRIAKLPLTLHLPRALDSLLREKLERAARTCPVHHSLRGDIEVDLNVSYDV